MLIYIRAKQQLEKLILRVLSTIGCLSIDRLFVFIHCHTTLIRRLDYSKNPKIRMFVESNVELNVRIKSVAKEPEMLPWIERFLEKNEVFYDIGANVGAYSLLASAIHKGEVDVICFEPSATNYAQLCRNIALNKWATRLVPIPIALTYSDTLLNFGYSDITAGAALHTVGAEHNNFQQFAYFQKVIAMALDDVIAKFDIPLPNLIKIDVDGAELGVLNGAVKTLKDHRLKSVLIELEEGTQIYREAKTILNSCGLFVKQKYRCIPNTNNPLWLNFYNFEFSRK